MPAICTPEFLAEYKANVHDWRWRVSNLYTVKPMGGGLPVRFTPNPIQRRFYNEMWRKNVVLKPRGIGMTTGILVYLLDACYDIPNFSCALSAHTEDKANEIFQDQIKFPHDNCDYPIKKGLKEGTYGSKSELQFENGSRIAVYVTLAGGSHQAVMSTELGVQSALDPEAAKNFKMQGLPTVRDEDGFVFIESTGQGGPQGIFYDTCLAAREETNMILAGKLKKSKSSYRFHFFPWFEDPRKVRKHEYPITKEDATYFAKIERECKVTLNNEQKWWYCEKANGPEGLAKIGEMHSQYPSTFDEAFESFVQDAYLTEALGRASSEGRIGNFKYNPAYPVDTWWDLGLDGTAIWFTQDTGNMVNCIWYYENFGPDLPHYLDYLQGGLAKLPWNKSRYRFHVAPHDAVKRDFATVNSVYKVAYNRGVKFESGIERAARKQDAIQAAMMFMHRCNIDKENCARGLQRLENYRPQWDIKLDMAKATPRHDKNSHGADAFQTMSQYHDKILQKHNEKPPPPSGQSVMPNDYPR